MPANYRVMGESDETSLDLILGLIWESRRWWNTDRRVSP